jgi:protein TonB
MKKIFAFCFAILGFTAMYSQAGKTGPSDDDKLYTAVQQNPNFPGDINKYFSDNIKYPDDARKNNIQGTVYVRFIVEKDGSVSKVVVLRGIEGGNSMNEEAKRVVSAMPKWIPGKQDGKAVRVQYQVPIRFSLVDVK